MWDVERVLHLLAPKTRVCIPAEWIFLGRCCGVTLVEVSDQETQGSNRMPTLCHTVCAPVLGNGQKHEMVATGMKRAQGGGFQRGSHRNPTLSPPHTGDIHISSMPCICACTCTPHKCTHTYTQPPPEQYHQPGHREGIKDKQGQCHQA